MQAIIEVSWLHLPRIKRLPEIDPRPQRYIRNSYDSAQRHVQDSMTEK